MPFGTSSLLELIGRLCMPALLDLIYYVSQHPLRAATMGNLSWTVSQTVEALVVATSFVYAPRVRYSAGVLSRWFFRLYSGRLFRCLGRCFFPREFAVSLGSRSVACVRHRNMCSYTSRPGFLLRRLRRGSLPREVFCQSLTAR